MKQEISTIEGPSSCKEDIKEKNSQGESYYWKIDIHLFAREKPREQTKSISWR